MSVADRHGRQLTPDEWGGAGSEAIVVHYSPTLTGRTTVAAAAARLGISPDEYRRVFAELVECGHFIPRPDGEYDAEQMA